jgi:hypothetical protein
MEEEMKLKQRDQSAADGISPSSTVEPCTKKQKISTHVVGETERIGDSSMNDSVMKNSDPSSATLACSEMQPIITYERPASLDIASSMVKEGDDDSLSDGEIKQDGETHTDETNPMTVDTKRVRSFFNPMCFITRYPLCLTLFSFCHLSNHIDRLSMQMMKTLPI